MVFPRSKTNDFYANADQIIAGLCVRLLERSLYDDMQNENKMTVFCLGLSLLFE